MKRTIIGLILLLLGVGTQAFAFKTGRTYNGKPTYNVDGIEYIVMTDVDKEAGKVEYTGAYVVPSADKALKYSGKIIIPQKVAIGETEYPVVNFIKLSEYSENEDSSLEIVLPNSLIAISGVSTQFNERIKSIDIPASVIGLYGLSYKPDTLCIPKTIQIFGSVSKVKASYIIFEDGLATCAYYGVCCDNDSIIIPGSMVMQGCALSALNLEYVKIAKSSDATKSPILCDLFCRNSYRIKTIVCEYATPPEARENAFVLEKSNLDPLYPDVDPEDPYPYGYYPTMYDRATLYVPQEAIEVYKADPVWGKFKNILPIKDGVNDVATDDAQVVATEYHDLYGRRLEAPAERSITIRTDVYSDGTRRCTKVLH